MCISIFICICFLGYFSLKKSVILLEYQYMLSFDWVYGASSRYGPQCCNSPVKDTVRRGRNVF